MTRARHGMTKQEFLSTLRAALSGRLTAGLVEENVAYYEDYINTQIRLGNNEASVLSALGDPRLIAKSIITANSEESESDTMHDDGKEQTYGREDGYRTQVRGTAFPRVMAMPVWAWMIVGVLIVVLILSALFSLVSFLLPILLPIAVVVFFIKLFRDWLN